MKNGAARWRTKPISRITHPAPPFHAHPPFDPHSQLTFVLIYNSGCPKTVCFFPLQEEMAHFSKPQCRVLPEMDRDRPQEKRRDICMYIFRPEGKRRNMCMYIFNDLFAHSPAGGMKPSKKRFSAAAWRPPTYWLEPSPRPHNPPRRGS